MGENGLPFGTKIRRYWPIFLVVALTVTLLFISTNRRNVLAVTVNSELVGFVQTEDEVEKIITSLLAEEKESSGQEIKIAQEIKYNKVKKPMEQLTAPEQLKEILAAKIDFIGVGYQLSVDGKPVVWVKDQEDARLLVEKIKQMSRDRLEKDKNVVVQEVKIKEKIDGKTGFCSLKELKSVDEAAEVLLSGGVEARKHMVEEGDTLWSIAREYNLSVEQLRKANSEQKGDLLRIGQELSLVLPVPYLTVMTTEKALINKDIPYPTKVVEDSSLWSGVRKVKQRGQPGVKELTMLVKRENGKKQEETLISEKVVKEPTQEIVSRGVKALPSRGTGRFSWPVQGRITSSYGSRWGRMHQGIDVGAATGTPVKAADSGVVTEAGWKNGYGYTVVINHGGGITTLYGHNSRLLVSVGDTVDKGEVIAHVGSTGSSTGPHLHFEIRSGGRTVNPLNYFD